MVKRSQEANYFKIGVFVIIGFVLLVIAIFMFTSFSLFKKTITIETYFNESVQGLSVGSPVKFHGLTIGEVKKVTMVSQIYPKSLRSPTYSRYIYVKMIVDPAFLNISQGMDTTEALKRDVADGLRVKMALSGLAGSVYLDASYMSAEGNPALPIDWTPASVYVPSALSVLTKFTDSIQKVLQGLQDVNFKQFFGNVQTLADTTDKAMQRVNTLLAETQGNLTALSRNSAVASNNILGMTQRIKSNPSALIFGQPKPINPKEL
jgi:paraquat-inducible protein B